MEQILNTRILHKHDTEANWLLATDFVPKNGELIIYDPDAVHSYPRFKIGNNVDTLNNLPFCNHVSLEEGVGENSIQQLDGNLSMSKNSVAFGSNNTAGLKGFYIKAICFDTGEIILSDKQVTTAPPQILKNQTEKLPAGFYYNEGNFISWDWLIEKGIVTESITTLTEGIFANINEYEPFEQIHNKLVLPEGITHIENNIFYEENSGTSSGSDITTIVLPSTITTISPRAFLRCNIKDIAIPTSVVNVNEIEFDSWNQEEKALIHVYYSGSSIIESSKAFVVSYSEANAEVLGKTFTDKYAIRGTSDYIYNINDFVDSSIDITGYNLNDKINVMTPEKNHLLCGTISKIDSTYPIITMKDNKFYNFYTIAELQSLWNDYSDNAFVNHLTSKDYTLSVSTQPTIGLVDISECGFVIGLDNKSTGNYSSAEGYNNLAIGNYSSVKGGASIAMGEYSYSEGYLNVAQGEYSHTEGKETKTLSKAAHSEGVRTVVTNGYGHIEGYSQNCYLDIPESQMIPKIPLNDIDKEKILKIHKVKSFALGTGFDCHVEGADCLALANEAHAEGFKSIAWGQISHAQGEETIAKGRDSYTEGYKTIARGKGQHVQGRWNLEDTSVQDEYDYGTYAHIVGNGEKDKPSNAHTIDWNGNGWYQGSVQSTGSDYAEYFEWLDKNPNNEDRIGLLVTLDGDKIKLANYGDDILGIVSGTVAVLGDNYECEWNGKYLTDDFGRIIYEDVEEFGEVIIGEDENGNRITEIKSFGFHKSPKLNPDYNPEQTYINRANRPEWDAIGMIGKLYVRDDGTCEVNSYATVGFDGIATAIAEKTNMRVIERVNDSIIRVLLK